MPGGAFSFAFFLKKLSAFLYRRWASRPRPAATVPSFGAKRATTRTEEVATTGVVYALDGGHIKSRAIALVTNTISFMKSRVV